MTTRHRHFGIRAIRVALLTFALGISGTVLGTAAASAAVLHDQMDSPGADGVFSQFGTGAPNVDVEAADDFAVPAGQTWTIQSVDVTGVYDAGAGPVSSVNVYLYTDAGNLPGLQAFAQKNIAPSNGTPGPSFSAPVGAPPLAGGHTYWLSFQANLNGYPGAIWDWKNRAVQSGNPAAFRDTAGTVLGGCTAFKARSSPGCPGFASQPDQLFRLNGTTAATPTTKKRCKKGFKLKTVKKKGKKRKKCVKKRKKKR
jgi:hypothetical protein